MPLAGDDLKKEHEGILLSLNILEEMVRLQRNDENPALEDIRDLIDFFKLFVDKCHHGKEEQIYFPAMNEFSDDNHKQLIVEMFEEHGQGRRYITQMSAAIAGEYQEGLFLLSAGGFIDALRAHIERENTVVLPLAEQLLPVEKQAELGQAFETFEEEVIGAGTHDKLHEILHRLKEKYLNK
ncbi:MAG: hemerythrin [Peptococcaceae bacterium]|jgi:hemerythrin-like domain-containing protein|nr:hemerythrin [Peptococcaceae bacterium]